MCGNVRSDAALCSVIPLPLLLLFCYLFECCLRFCFCLDDLLLSYFFVYALILKVFFFKKLCVFS